MSAGELLVVVVGVANLAATGVGLGAIAVRLERRLSRLEKGAEEQDRRLDGVEGTLRDARILMLDRSSAPSPPA